MKNIVIHMETQVWTNINLIGIDNTICCALELGYFQNKMNNYFRI